MTGVASTTHLRPHTLPLLLRRRRPTQAPLPLPELPNSRITPRHGLFELGRQRLARVGLTRVASTTQLRPHRLQLRIPLLRSELRLAGGALASPELRKPLRTPRLSLSKGVPQRQTGMRFTRVTGATRLRPHLLRRRLPRPSSLPLPELRKPIRCPPRALSERVPQRQTGMRFTRVTGATHLRPHPLQLRLPLALHQLRPARSPLPLPAFRKARVGPRHALAELGGQRRTGVRFARGVSLPHLRPHRIQMHVLHRRIHPAHIALTPPDLRRLLLSRRSALFELGLQRTTRVGLTRVPGRTRRGPHVLQIHSPLPLHRVRQRDRLLRRRLRLDILITRVINPTPLAPIAFTHRGQPTRIPHRRRLIRIIRNRLRRKHIRVRYRDPLRRHGLRRDIIRLVVLHLIPPKSQRLPDARWINGPPFHLFRRCGPVQQGAPLLRLEQIERHQAVKQFGRSRPRIRDSCR